MVGVSGKSKGCKTCRKRKIACDLQRPSCSQCIKSEKVCLGYDREIRFVPVQARVKNDKLVLASSFEKPLPERPEGCETPDAAPRSPASSAQHSVPSTSRYQVSATLTQFRSFDAAENRQQLLNIFMSTCERGHVDSLPSRPIGERGPWLLLLPQLSLTAPALEASILAIAASVLGRQRNDRDLIRASLKFYTSALQKLQKSLWDPDMMYDDEILAACLCLGLYEVIECPGGCQQAYYNHCKGCMKLIESRGASRHISGIAHELFLGLRAQGALLSMADHIPTFLSSPLWMNVPWKLHSKRPLDRLVDCLCEASLIYQEDDRVKHLGPTQKLEFWLKCLKKCWQMDALLQDVYHAFETDFAQPMYWSVLSKEPNSADDPILGKVFPVAYRFVDLAVARSLMIYWAVALLVWNGLSLLHYGVASLEFCAEDAHCLHSPECRAFRNDPCHRGNFQRQPSGTYKYNLSRLPSLGHRVNSRLLVNNVCQSVEYCLESKENIWGPWSAGTPLTLTYETAKFFPQMRREVKWMEATLRKLQDRGLRILSYSTSMNQSKSQG